MQLNPASLPFFVGAALSGWLVVLAWPRRNEPSAPPLISLLVFEGLWALCEGIEAVLLDPSAKAVIYGLKLSAVALVPPSLLFFILEYTGRTGAAPPRFKVLILAVPAISISLIATSGEHSLFLTGMDQVDIGGYQLLSPRYGPAFWIHTSYCYALLCLSAWLLARSALAMGGVLRKQMLFLSACLLIPLVINVADMLKLIPMPYREYDLTAGTFVVTGVLGFLLLRRFHLINVAPVSYSLVVQEMLDAIIVLDASRRIVGVNRAAVGLMGRVDRDIIGLRGDMLPGWLEIPEHLSKLEGAAELSYRLGADSGDSGYAYDVRVSRFPHGREPGWLVIIRDISAQSRAEVEQTARIAAEQANLTKDAFLAKLGHELRTPLTPVLAIVSAALDDRSIAPELRSSLEIVQRNVHLEARLIDDLLDQSLISLGKLRLRTELIDAHVLLRQSLEDCARSSGMPASPLASIWPRRKAGWPPIRDGSGKSSGTSSPTPRGTRLPAVSSRSARGTSRRVPWRSSSRTKAAASRRRNSARSSSRSSKVQPTVPNDVRGWALACRSAGGSSKLTGEPSLRRVPVPGEVPLSGSCSAPPIAPRSRRSINRSRAARPPSRPPQLSPSGPATRERPRRSSSWRTTPIPCALSMSLSQLGYEVRPADSLRTALAAAENGGYDLILSDLELGDGTGLELLRSMGPGRSAPAIAITGYGSEEDRKMCLEAGFETHLIKPIETRQLDEAIRSVIQKHSINS